MNDGDDAGEISKRLKSLVFGTVCGAHEHRWIEGSVTHRRVGRRTSSALFSLHNGRPRRRGAHLFSNYLSGGRGGEAVPSALLSVKLACSNARAAQRETSSAPA